MKSLMQTNALSCFLHDRAISPAAAPTKFYLALQLILTNIQVTTTLFHLHIALARNPQKRKNQSLLALFTTTHIHTQYYSH